jgi:SAM-dependent methyltransferase
MSYADITLHDPNPIKRWLHERRLDDALKPLNGTAATFRGVVCDFGAGDGELCRRLAARFPLATICGYEPSRALLDEAKTNLRGIRNVVLASRSDQIAGVRSDFSFCTEVFEHLPGPETQQLMDLLRASLKPSGTLVIGVPNELHLAAALKGLLRLARRRGAFDARVGNIVRCALGHPPTDRPLAELEPGLRYHPYHPGFDHRAFAKTVSRTFAIRRSFGSPLPFLGASLSFEVYLVCGLREG